MWRKDWLEIFSILHPIITFLIIGALSSIILILSVVFDLEFLPPQLSKLKLYIFVVATVFLFVCVVSGVLLSRQFGRVEMVVPRDILFVENRHCHVLHQISVAEYSRIAQHLLERLRDQPAKTFNTLVVFAMCAFEPYEIWRILEQNWRNRGNHTSPTVDDLYEIAKLLFPHFQLFSDFGESYPTAIGRLLLLPPDWRSRNKRDHFELFCKLNGNVECYVALATDFPHIQFKTDHTIIQDVLLDYYTDSQTLIISFLDRWQNPQVCNYLLGLKDCYKNRVPQLKSLETWRRDNGV